MPFEPLPPKTEAGVMSANIHPIPGSGWPTPSANSEILTGIKSGAAPPRASGMEAYGGQHHLNWGLPDMDRRGVTGSTIPGGRS